MAKVARVEISKEFLEEFLRADFFQRPNSIITSDAPKDLEVLGLAKTERDFGYPVSFYVYCKSETFADVPEGQEPPLLHPFIFTVTQVDETR